MTMIVAALALFAAVWAAMAAARADAPGAPDIADTPNGLPNPGPRDVFTVSTGTLGRAPVPRWT